MTSFDGRYVGFSDETDFSTQDDQLDNIPATKPPNQDGFSDSEKDGPCGNSGSSRDDMDLEDLLLDSTNKPIDDFYNRQGDWLEVDGQQYLKSSLVTQHLKANHSKKVIERTLRVRSLTLDNLQKHPMELPVDPDGDNFQVRDLVATLIRTDSFICLAIIQTIGIRKDQSTHHVIKTEALYNMKEGYTVQGEVLRVVQASPSMWAWPPHDFMKVSKPKKSKPKKSAVRDFAVSIPGVLCHRINPNVSPIPNQLHSSGSLYPILPLKDETWTFDAAELLQLLQSMWSDFQPENERDLEEKAESLP